MGSRVGVGHEGFPRARGEKTLLFDHAPEPVVGGGDVGDAFAFLRQMALQPVDVTAVGPGSEGRRHSDALLGLLVGDDGVRHFAAARLVMAVASRAGDGLRGRSGRARGRR